MNGGTQTQTPSDGERKKVKTKNINTSNGGTHADANTHAEKGHYRILMTPLNICRRHQIQDGKEGKNISKNNMNMQKVADAREESE